MAARWWLFAGLGAAGILLINLPASAQLSNDTSTFNGEVAATCSFGDLADTIQLAYYGSNNQLHGYTSFDLVTNVANPRFELSAVTVNSEPSALNNSSVSAYGRLQRYVPNQWGIVATSTKTLSAVTAPIDISQGNRFLLEVFNLTNNRVGGKYQLAPGFYSYTITLSCLL